MVAHLLITIGLELYALTLALVQGWSGIHTDEAKYLLNIPYPHPPFARALLSLAEPLASQEFLARFLFASLLVQGVWFVWWMTVRWGRRDRIVLAVLWLVSASVVLQAGSIMVTTLTSLQGLAFTALYLRKDRDFTPWASWISLLFLISLFTSYKILLFLPLIVLVLLRLRVPPSLRFAFLGIPLFLLALYTLTNPLALASIVQAGRDNVSLPLSTWFSGALSPFLIGGSVILSVLGTTAMFWSRSIPLFLSLLLVFLYSLLSARSYHAILFTPLFIGGLASNPSFLRGPTLSFLPRTSSLVLALTLALTLSIVWASPLPSPSPAREVMRGLAEKGIGGPILIQGSFGHEWQYESRQPILRFRIELLPEASAVICLRSCEGISDAPGWRQLEDAPVEVWVRG